MNRLYNEYKNVWQAFNPSGALNVMTKEVEKHLTNYKYNIDIHGNIFIGDFEKSIPCLVAHLDSVHTKKSKHFSLKNSILKSENGIGGDDKCGIIAILEILKDNSTIINAIFPVDEEIGGIGSSYIQYDILKNVSYFIEIDRANNNDIIYNSGGNQMASASFIEALAPYANMYDYEENFGSFTDVNVLTETSKKCAINISCGYYNAHTKKEYVNLKHLQKTIKFVNDVINNIKESYVWEKTQDNFNCHYDINKCEFDYFMEYVSKQGYNEEVINLIWEAYEIGLDESKLSLNY